MRDAEEPSSFGALLRRHRLAAGLTQEQLAARCGLGTRGIQNLERDANRPHRETLRLLASHLALAGEQRARFEAAARPVPRGPSADQTLRPLPHPDRFKDSADDPVLNVPNNLPIQWTSFVGREQPTSDVLQLLESTHLLTLTGTGGCGKTRLAIEVAKHRSDASPDGVWLIDLAPLADSALIAQAAASTIGVREVPGESSLQTLIQYLRAKRVFLVFDNCEHLIEGSAQVVAAILRSCPRVGALATSREALRITGEVIWRVPSLAVPPPIAETSSSLDQVVAYEATRLFIDRARAVHPGFQLVEQNVAAVIQICRDLDGIPLALELAAARVGALGVEEIAARLDDRFRLLTGGSRAARPRQQTLRATVDWSYDLLAEPERVLFRRLAVFAGSWTLTAAETVGGGEGIEVREVLDLLSHLVDKSLIVVEEGIDGSERYRLLETLRQYGLERLAESGGELPATQRQHATYYLALAEQAGAEWSGPRANAMHNRLDLDRGNLRSALQWLRANGDVAAGLKMGIGLGQLWLTRGPLTEGRDQLRELLAASVGSGPREIRALALSWLAELTRRQGDRAEATVHFTESLAIYRELGDRSGEGRTLASLGNVEFLQGRYASARRWLEEGLVIARELADRGAVGSSLEILGQVALNQGDLGTARRFLEDALAIARERGDRRRGIHEQHSLGEVALEEGNLAEARSLFWEALATARDTNDQTLVGHTLVGMASLAAVQRQPERAIRLAGAAAAQLAAFGAVLAPTWSARSERWLQPAKAMLSEEARTAAWAEGQAMTLEQAVDDALAEDS